MGFYDMHVELERVRDQEGEEAYNKTVHGLIGGTWGMTGGALAGATVGSVVPGVGTAVGAVVGGLAGLFAGVQDETAMDNVRTGAKTVRRALGFWSTDGAS